MKNRGQLENLILAVRETGVSPHNGAQLRAPLNPQCNSAVMYGGLQGGPKLVLHDAETLTAIK